jgi:hypothetical protein
MKIMLMMIWEQISFSSPFFLFHPEKVIAAPQEM